MVLVSQDNSQFSDRHIGPRDSDVQEMLRCLGLSKLDELIGQTVPESIQIDRDLDLPEGYSEDGLLDYITRISSDNEIFKSYIGMGYYDTIVPNVISRNVLENPGWYTAYTPYQAEISQGRLEALLNFQTMVIDLTGLEIANASLLDESTAAAEAMTMLYGEIGDDGRSSFFVSNNCHPQTVEVVRGRAAPMGIKVVVGSERQFLEEDKQMFFGSLVQYPGTDGLLVDYTDFCEIAHSSGVSVVMAADLLALTLVKPPGEMGADVAVGSTQRFGVPMGFGGPHAAYFATGEKFKRKLPGRIIGVSKDVEGRPALRMALQTREQHIRRGKATSNICTAQVLLAVMAGMYAVYHGPEGLKSIATRIHLLTKLLASGLKEMDQHVRHGAFFDTLQIDVGEKSVQELLHRARERKINLRDYGKGFIGISIDETTSQKHIERLLSVFDLDNNHTGVNSQWAPELVSSVALSIPKELERASSFLQHPVFQRYHSESEMLRYLNRLENKDLSLTTSMIPLGSCTMKLNATAEMIPVTWNTFGRLHPFAPVDQAKGYQKIFADLKRWLSEISGLEHTSLQPNSGAQGEYTGLLVIKAYHESVGQGHRNVCLIPTSAHGTNPASAVLAGMKVVPVQCDASGNIDLTDLREKAEHNSEGLAALMVTYPSTHGVFESGIREICDIIHQFGGRVYLDGANLNAQVGLCRPGDYGADVCHINLHKTFSIPHGGGGPGMGPICVTSELAPFLPGHPQADCGGEQGIRPVSAAPWGSSSILLISWAYIALLGRAGVKRATQVAILNANYMESRLRDQFEVLYRGDLGRVAHEFIIDLREFKKTVDISAEDVAKRLIDYGFHAPTVSFPVAGTIMIEPTESESRQELDRFCEALLSIREEIREVELGQADPTNNVLKNSPHTAAFVSSSDWPCDYPREKAVYPASWTREHKYWVPVRRIDNVQGDRNLICACPPLEDYIEE